MAVVFVVLMAAMIMMASMMMNAGEVAALRTQTSNAADAGALAGASWVASGENEAVDIANSMWMNAYLVQKIYSIPFCHNISTLQIEQIWMGLFTANQYLTLIANDVLGATYRRARMMAYFTALGNSILDDPTGSVNLVVQEMLQAYETTGDIPGGINTDFYDWYRGGAGGVNSGHSRLTVRISGEPGQPTLRVKGWQPWAYRMRPCETVSAGGFSWNCCLPSPIAAPWVRADTFAFPGQVTNARNAISPGAAAVRAFEGAPYERKRWGDLNFIHNPSFGWLNNFLGTGPEMVRGTCDGCFYEIVTNFGAGITGGLLPDRIQRANGDIRVTVNHWRDPNGAPQLAFWRMRYPGQGVTSRGTARYEGATVGDQVGPGASGETGTYAEAFLSNVR